MNDFEKNIEMLTGIYLGGDLQQQLREQSISLIFTFFFKDGLFNDESVNCSRISGNVVGMTLSNNSGEPNGSFW